MLDLDNMGLEEVRYWAYWACKKYKLRGFYILRSSTRNYHIIFNRAVSWAENASIVASLCLELKRESLTKWFLLQCIKGAPTLRTSIKGKKPQPRIVYRYGKQNGKIKEYLQDRKFGRLVKMKVNPNIDLKIMKAFKRKI
jgi:hypothetical protein